MERFQVRLRPHFPTRRSAATCMQVFLQNRQADNFIFFKEKVQVLRQPETFLTLDFLTLDIGPRAVVPIAAVNMGWGAWWLPDSGPGGDRTGGLAITVLGPDNDQTGAWR